jgi:hypothetical protein
MLACFLGINITVHGNDLVATTDAICNNSDRNSADNLLSSGNPESKLRMRLIECVCRNKKYTFTNICKVMIKNTIYIQQRIIPVIMLPLFTYSVFAICFGMYTVTTREINTIDTIL